MSGISGGTILITGANGAIGRETVRHLLAASPGSHYLLTVRNPEDENSLRLQAIVTHASSSSTSPIKAELVTLDLGELQDVRDAAQSIMARVKSSRLPPITHIVAQAGTQFQTSQLHMSKKEPICELTFGVNHLSHALLFVTLLPVLHPDGRVITLSSSSHDPAAGWNIPVEYRSVQEMAVPDESQAATSRGGLRRYATSKGCQTMFAISFAEYLSKSSDHRRVRSALFEPGVNLSTGLLRSAPLAGQWLALIMGSTAMTFVLQKLWRSDVRVPSTSGALLATLILDKPLSDTECEYWAGDELQQPSHDVQDKERRDKLWRETLDYLMEKRLISETLLQA